MKKKKTTALHKLKKKAKVKSKKMNSMLSNYLHHVLIDFDEGNFMTKLDIARSKPKK